MSLVLRLMRLCQFCQFFSFSSTLSNFISSDDVFTCPFIINYKWVYICVTVVIHFVSLHAAHRDRRTQCRGRRRSSRTSTSLGNPASSEQCHQRRRRAADTDGKTWRRNRPSEKNPSVQNVETETGETGKFLKEPHNPNLKNPEKEASNIWGAKQREKNRQLVF